jgi:hypothetical protein
VHEVLTVDKELLVWAAAARWLGRNRVRVLADAARLSYEALCLRLSGGRSHDTLGLELGVSESAAEEAS